MAFVVACALTMSLRSFAEANQNLLSKYSHTCFTTGLLRQPFDGFLAMTTKMVGI